MRGSTALVREPPKGSRHLGPTDEKHVQLTVDKFPTYAGQLPVHDGGKSRFRI